MSKPSVSFHHIFNVMYESVWCLGSGLGIQISAERTCARRALSESAKDQSWWPCPERCHACRLGYDKEGNKVSHYETLVDTPAAVAATYVDKSQSPPQKMLSVRADVTKSEDIYHCFRRLLRESQPKDSRWQIVPDEVYWFIGDDAVKVYKSKSIDGATRSPFPEPPEWLNWPERYRFSLTPHSPPPPSSPPASAHPDSSQASAAPAGLLPADQACHSTGDSPASPARA